MIKTIAGWILLILGALLLLGAIVSIGTQITENLQSRKAWGPAVPLRRMADFMGFSTGKSVFLTDPWAFLLAQIGLGFLLIAMGLHLRLLVRQEIGQQRLKQQSFRSPN